MLPARNVCPSREWTREYQGYLMTGSSNSTRSEYICVDNDATGVNQLHSKSHPGKALLTSVLGKCGVLPCPPYEQDRELTCAVCTMWQKVSSQTGFIGDELLSKRITAWKGLVSQLIIIFHFLFFQRVSNQWAKRTLKISFTTPESTLRFFIYPWKANRSTTKQSTIGVGSHSLISNPCKK